MFTTAMLGFRNENLIAFFLFRLIQLLALGSIAVNTISDASS
jgi:hypothetical protein